MNIRSQTCRPATPNASFSGNGSVRAFSVVEALLAAALFSIFAVGFTGAYLFGEEATLLSGNRTRAVFLAEEGLEASRSIRDESFSNLSDGAFGLSSAGHEWNFSGSSDLSGIFTRTVTVSSVSENRKKITSTVTWPHAAGRTGSVSLETYLTNWIAFVSQIGDWSLPSQESSEDAPGNNNGLRVAVSGGFAYFVKSAGLGNFHSVDVDPPSAPAIVSTMSLSGIPSNIAISGNFAYVSSTNDNRELEIVDISNPSLPVLVGFFNAPGTADALGVSAVGSTVFLVRSNSGNDEFLILDASVPATPALLGSLNLGASASEVAVSGSFAFIASSDNARELSVVNIASLSSPVLAGSLNLSGNTDALTVAVSGTTAYLGQGSSFFSINIAVPGSPSLSDSISLGGLVNDIAVDFAGSSFAFVGTSNTGAEFQVVERSAPSALSLAGSVNMAGNNAISGVAYDASLDRAFGVSGSNSEEFLVFSPQ